MIHSIPVSVEVDHIEECLKEEDVDEGEEVCGWDESHQEQSELAYGDTITHENAFKGVKHAVHLDNLLFLLGGWSLY